MRTTIQITGSGTSYHRSRPAGHLCAVERLRGRQRPARRQHAWRQRHHQRGQPACRRGPADGGRRGGQRHHHRQRRQRRADRRRRQRLHHRRPRQRRRLPAAPATTRSCGTPATAATWSRARAAPTRCSSTAPTPTRTSTSRPTAAALRLFRDVGNVTMDLNGVEQVNFDALGGADTITVNDLTGTGVTAGQPRPGRHARRAAPATARPTPSSSTAPPAPTPSRSAGSAARHRGLGPGRLGAYHRDAEAANDQPHGQRPRRQRHDRRRPGCHAGCDRADAQTAAMAMTSSSAAPGNDLDHRRTRQRRRLHRRGRRHVRVEPRRRQRHRRGPGRPRHVAVQRRQRQREHRPLGQRQPGAVLPRRRQRHDGPQRRRAGQLQRPGRRRHHHRQRPDRHRRHRRSTSTSRARPAAAPATARPTPSSSTAPTGTTRSRSPATPSGADRPGSGCPGEYRRRRGGQRPA